MGRTLRADAHQGPTCELQGCFRRQLTQQLLGTKFMGHQYPRMHMLTDAGYLFTVCHSYIQSLELVCWMVQRELRAEQRQESSPHPQDCCPLGARDLRRTLPSRQRRLLRVSHRDEGARALKLTISTQGRDEGRDREVWCHCCCAILQERFRRTSTEGPGRLRRSQVSFSVIFYCSELIRPP